MMTLLVDMDISITSVTFETENQQSFNIDKKNQFKYKQDL